MQRGGFVYILTNKTHTVLYTGVTSDLIKRLHEHFSGSKPNCFTNKYNVYKLVYYKPFLYKTEAIVEEKRIKAGSRRNKIQLIESQNSFWKDLWIEEVSKW